MKLEDRIRKVVPYVPGEQPKETNIIKLNTNECPYPPSKSVEEALNSMDKDRFRLYPDPAAADLVKALADHYGLSKDQVFVGVGSDDVLSMCFLTYFHSKDPVYFPDITYSFYDVWCDVYEIPYETKELSNDFTINPDDYIDSKAGGIVIANPNAPTGVLMPLDTIEEIVRTNPDKVVIVDEAYVDFGGISAIPLIEKYNNIVICQTFSKSWAMAGMRIGCALACPELIKAINDVKYSVNSYTMNMPSIVAGVAAVGDEAYFKEITGKIIKTREEAKKRLGELGFEFADSKANFIFAKHNTVSGDKIFNELKQRKIFVRHWNKPRIADYLRITIGTDEQMGKLYEALEEIVM